jgi:signal transduction histidine kinase
MRLPRRWLAVAFAVLIVGTVEALSDTVFDAVLPFPFHTLLVVAMVTIVVATGAIYSFPLIDRLNQDLRDRNAVLESRNAVLRAVYDVSLAVSGRADPGRTIASIVDHARTLLRADGALLAMDGPGGGLRLRAASAAPGVLVGEDASRGQIMAMDEDDLGCYLRTGYRIGLTAPVGHGDRRVGALGIVLEAGSRRRFDQEEVETLTALATQLGVALEAARLQDELQLLAVQGERERIAREMHDGLSQVLGYVNTKSQAVEEMLAAGRVADARAQLAELAAAARSVYIDVREAILTLSPPAPSDRGVAAALEDYAGRYAESSKLAVRFDAAPEAVETVLSAAAQAEIFSIAREALTNVRKHARAQRVTIDFSRAASKLMLTIADDGVGFDSDLVAAGPERWPHFGLAGMRERAEAIGAAIAWRSTPNGTVVELQVPVGASSWSSPLNESASSGETKGPAQQDQAEQHQAVRSPVTTQSEAD